MSRSKTIRPALLCLALFLSLNLLNLSQPVTVARAALDPFPPYYLDPPPGPPMNQPLTNLPTGPIHQKFGIAAHPWWLDMFLEQFIGYYKDLKITNVRIPFEWKSIEPGPGVFDWSREDRLFNRLNDEGIEVVAEYVTIPPWASLNPDECAKDDIYCKPDPKYTDQFVLAAQSAARRYPFIRYWEFWNEPDLWPYLGRRDISDYATWLKLYYDAVKKVDKTLMVAATSLSGPEYTDWLYRYCDIVYGMRPWDAIAYHPYNQDKIPDPNTGREMSMQKPRIDYLRQLMVQYGDANKPIWLTEIGWQDTAPDVQAMQLMDAFNFVASRPYVTMIHIHMLHDWDGERYGLLKVKGEDIFWKRKLNKNDQFEPKQPYYDTFKVYNKRLLPDRPQPDPNVLVFGETRHTVRDVFRKAYERGGVALFGFPKTGQFYERNPSDGKYYLVQYFERVRMEYHPEFAGTPNEVLFGLLGNQLLTERGWLDGNGMAISGAALPEDKPGTLPNDTVWFQETRHTLSGAFLDAWKKQGGLAIVGLPKTRVFEERNPDDGGTYQVQYFERARMELHPAKNGQPPFVLFGLLGNDRLRLQGRILSDNQPDLNNYFNPALPEFKV